MSASKNIFESNLDSLSRPSFISALKDIKHGVERETLRVNKQGGLAYTDHPKELGSALTHDYITTDFSEALLEFITPPDKNIATSIEQLIDIHKYTYGAINDELLWPLSMPCFISSETDIPIAKYGSSNIAKMKEVYRKGLHHRYGSMMQVISGVHFNFSLPESFWQLWCELSGQDWNKHTQSAHYYALIRNFRRFAWVIPYLFGASPALCGSFLAHKKDLKHPFQSTGKGTLYLPYATSLRMSDLGYTSSAQSSLHICYNELDSYVASLRNAISQHAPEYQQISCNDQEGWNQLNSNILQIENELYSPIRPKQVAKPNEMPSKALENRGVSYIEVRSLDVNPFSPIGIDAEQFYFLDVFLLYCLIKPSDDFSKDCFAMTQDNINKTVLRGRDPDLKLNKFGELNSIQQWGEELTKELLMVSAILDRNSVNNEYTSAVLSQQNKFNDPSVTLSGRWLDTLLSNQIDNSALGLELAKQYKHHVSNFKYNQFDEAMFKQQAVDSMKAQEAIERKDTTGFAQFVSEYFSEIKA